MIESGVDLPPFPDELLRADSKEKAIGFLRALGVPNRIAARNLRRWGQYVGVELTRDDFVRVDPPITLPPELR